MSSEHESFSPHEEPPDSGARRQLNSDARALVQSSLRELPGIDQTSRLLRQRSEVLNREVWLMKLFRSIQARPWLSSSLAAGSAALVVSLVPISYDHVSGYESRLELVGVASGAASIDLVARQFKQAVHAAGITIQKGVDPASGGTSAILTARVNRASRVTVDLSAQAFVRELAQRGYHASASVKPVVEHKLGSMVAMAADRAREIRINAKGKSVDQIAAEIRTQLEAAGLPGATVDVTREGDQTRIKIEAVRHDDQGGGAEPRIVVDSGTEGKAKQRIVRIHSHGKLSDAEIQAEVEKQLQAQGSKAKVRVTNGKIEVEDEK